LEDLSEASFLDKLLVLPANVRLDWKVIARYKHSSLFGIVISNKEKKFYNIDTCCFSFKTFFFFITNEEPEQAQDNAPVKIFQSSLVFAG
jgi:hypothetical protein